MKSVNKLQVKGKSRKQQRKEMRKQKKINRNEYYTNRKKPGQFVLNPNKNKEVEMNDNSSEHFKDTDKNVLSNQILSTEQLRKKEQKEQRKIERDMRKHRNRHLLEANKDEDRIIKQLEKQLGLNKRKTKALPKSFSEEGLDYLLDVCDSDKMKNALTTGTDLHDNDFEEDFALMTKTSEISEEQYNEDDIDEYADETECSDEFEENDDSDQNEIEDENMECVETVSNSDSNEQIENTIKTKKKTSNIKSDLNKPKKTSHNTSELEDDDNDNDDLILKHNGKRKKKQKKVNKKQKTEIKNKNNQNEQIEMDTFEIESADNFSEEENVDEKQIKGAVKINDNGTWEDIYGRLRTKDGSIITNAKQSKYIPPGAREKLTINLSESKQTEKLGRLRRHLKGFLNRLAESNLHYITSQIEEFYMNNSRNDMNDTITNLITESLITEITTPERLLIDHIVLIAILHANVGTEVGAHFLQQIIKMFDEYLTVKQDIEDKTLDNTVKVLAQLYNFKIFDSHLMYEILQKLAEEFTEKCVECILHILRGIGFTLRKDNPLALKNLILDVQKRAATVSNEEETDPRLKFMLDVLLAIKNNNVTKIPNYDVSYSEHLKKVLKGHIRKGNVVTQLNISLEDLLKAQERGKWWVVGSAWTGAETSVEKSKGTDDKPSYSLKLLELAKKQRMNTDTRRNIFCIIMSAEDYLDAFENILKLGLKNQQEREIINVILHCCLQEKKYNPYYAYLTQKFCDYDRKYQMSIKYSIWDKLKALTDHSGYQISNLAKLLIHLLIEKGLPISILKIIQFSDLDKISLRFMRQILIGILVHQDEESCLEVFAKLTKSEKLKMFRESLKLFIHHFLLRNIKTDGIPQDQKNLLEGRAKRVEKVLSPKDKF